jgi:hypothetical protein
MLSPTRFGLGSVVVFVVLLAGGALPALSSPVSGPQATPTASAPLRVLNPAAYQRAKAAAARRYTQWQQLHGFAPSTAATAPQTSVSGSLNAPGITDSQTFGTRGITPADTTGAIGPSNYVEFVNSEMAVYGNTDLSTPQATLTESAFTGDTDPCDGQIQWDQQGQRWLYAMLSCGAAAGSEAFYFGWSKTPSPDLSLSNWCQYTVHTGNDIEDYPKLGHDASQIIIGTNRFDDVSGNYLQSNIWVFDKPAPGDTSCPTSTTEKVASTTPIVVGDVTGGAFTPVPANVADSSATGYVVAIDQDQAHLDLYAIGRDSGGNSVLQSATSVTVPAFTFPANVPQPGLATDVIDTSDTRLTQAVAVTDPATGKEGIWTQHTIDGGGPSVVRWYELTPGATTPTRTGTVSAPGGAFAFNAAISPTATGSNAVIDYNTGSATQLVDWRAQDPTVAPVQDIQLATSSNADSDFSCPSWDTSAASCRWGDYAGASPDPSNPCLVWGTGELTTFPIDTTATHRAQWGTQNAAIDACFTLAVTTTGTGSGTVSSNPAGISCGSTCSYEFGGGKSVTLTATPAAGSGLLGWSGACSGIGTCTVTMNQARTVTATFVPVETLTVIKAGKGSGTVHSSPAGISCGSTCAYAYPQGSAVTLTGTAGKGSAFSGWSGACTGKGTCNVAMSAAQAVYAKFAKLVCIVPKVKGKRLKAAKRALTKAHCRAGKITRRYAKAEKGRVIRQKPGARRHRPNRTKVSLVVSKGKKR